MNGQWTAAIQEYTHYIALVPREDCLCAYINRAADYMVLGDYAHAEADYRMVLAIDPSNEKGHYGLGRVLEKTKNYAASQAEFTRVLHIDPTDAYAYIDRGHDDYSLHEMARAANDFSRFLLLDPHSQYLGEAYFGRGQEYLALKAYKQAIADFSASLQQPPFDAHAGADAYLNRGSAESRLGRRDAARADLQTAVTDYQADGFPDLAAHAQKLLSSL